MQSTVRQDVLKGDLITELPVARNIQNVVILIPGMTVTGKLDVGGLRSGAEVNNFSAHGGRIDDGRLLVDGMNVGGPTGGAGANSGGGGTSYFQADVGNAAGGGGDDVGRARRGRIGRPRHQRHPALRRQRPVGLVLLQLRERQLSRART